MCYHFSGLLFWWKRQCKYSLIHFTRYQAGKYKQTAWQIWRAHALLASADGRGQSSLASKECPRTKNSSTFILRSQMGCLNLTLMSMRPVDASWSLGTTVSNVLSVLCITHFRVPCPKVGFHYSYGSSIDMTVSDLESWDTVHCSRVQAWDDNTGPGSQRRSHSYKQIPHGQLRKCRAGQNWWRSNRQSKEQVSSLCKTHSTQQIWTWHGLVLEQGGIRIGWLRFAGNIES